MVALREPRNEYGPARGQPRTGQHGKYDRRAPNRSGEAKQDAVVVFHKKIAHLVTLASLRAPKCALKVAGVLLDHADGRGSCHPGTKRIKEQCGLEQAAVYKGISWLVEHGLLRREKDGATGRKVFVIVYAASDKVNLYGNLRNKFTWISRILKSGRRRADALVAVSYLPHARPTGAQIVALTGLSESEASSARQRLLVAGHLVDPGGGGRLPVANLPDPAVEAAAARWEAFAALWPFDLCELPRPAREAFLALTADEQAQALAQAAPYLAWCAAEGQRYCSAKRWLTEKKFERVAERRKTETPKSASGEFGSRGISGSSPVEKIDAHNKEVNSSFRTDPLYLQSPPGFGRGSPRGEPRALANLPPPVAAFPRTPLGVALAALERNILSRPAPSCGPEAGT
jgi:hypothetical protein